MADDVKRALIVALIMAVAAHINIEKSGICVCGKRAII